MNDLNNIRDQAKQRLQLTQTLIYEALLAKYRIVQYTTHKALQTC